MNEDEVLETEAEEKRVVAARAARAALQAAHAAALFGVHAAWLRRYVGRLADNRSLPPSFLDPDDVVQEAFVQLLRHDRAEPIRNPGAWLCVVVRNQVSKAAQQHRHFTDDDPAAHIEVGTAEWSSVARQASTEDIQAARAAVDAIARLDGNQQVATYLRHVQGWSQAEIAAYLECSASAAGVHVHRGTTRVRDTGQRYEAPAPDRQHPAPARQRSLRALLRALRRHTGWRRVLAGSSLAVLLVAGPMVWGLPPDAGIVAMGWTILAGLALGAAGIVALLVEAVVILTIEGIGDLIRRVADRRARRR